MATFPLVPLMSVATALQENLAQLVKDKSSRNLPRPVMAHDPFVEFIGFKEIEAQQMEYLPNPLAAKKAAAA